MLVGRTWADLVRNVFVVVLMAVVGFLVGWRISTNVLGLIAGLLIVLLFAYSLSWLFAIVGLVATGRGDRAGRVVPDPRTAGLRVRRPSCRSSTMPGWLQVFAKHQPVSAVCNAVRALTIGGPTTSYVIEALAWIVGIVAICAPLAVRKYRQAT